MEGEWFSIVDSWKPYAFSVCSASMAINFFPIPQPAPERAFFRMRFSSVPVIRYSHY